MQSLKRIQLSSLPTSTTTTNTDAISNAEFEEYLTPLASHHKHKCLSFIYLFIKCQVWRVTYPPLLPFPPPPPIIASPSLPCGQDKCVLQFVLIFLYFFSFLLNFSSFSSSFWSSGWTTFPPGKTLVTYATAHHMQALVLISLICDESGFCLLEVNILVRVRCYLWELFD